MNFKTRTPKGDGNYGDQLKAATDEKISEHEPRKGTETGRSL